jgi:hypothetical protein
MKNRPKNNKNGNINEKYRRILRMPSLKEKEIEETRKNLIIFAQIICEHFWGKNLY